MLSEYNSSLLVYEDTHIPIISINGEGSGPVVWIQGGMHGDEYDGIAACLRFMEKLKSTLKAGTVIVVPVMNQGAVLAGTCKTPKDNINLNRVFGQESGESWSFRFGEWYAGIVSSRADYFIDLHGGGLYLDVSDFAFAPDASAVELAKNTRVDFICKKDQKGMLVDELARRGICSLLHESGGGPGVLEDAIKRHIAFLKDILSGLGMIEREEEIPRNRALLLEQAMDIYFPQPALQLGNLPCGAYVRAGEKLAWGVSPNDLSDWEFRCPPPGGYILSIHTAACVSSGDYAAMIGI